MFLFLQMFQNNNTIKTFVNLQHTWKIPFRVVILSMLSFSLWLLNLDKRGKFVHEAEIKALAAAVHKNSYLWVKKCWSLNYYVKQIWFVQLFCFKNYFPILWKLPSIFLTVLIFINTGKHRKVLCTNMSANINNCFFELEKVLHRKRDIISARGHWARCTSNAGVWLVIRKYMLICVEKGFSY